MRLTKDDKSAFVSAVMADVPNVDYAELARDYINSEVGAFLPPKIREIWRDGGLKGFIACSLRVRIPGINYRLAEVPEVGDTNGFREQIKDKLGELGVLDVAQTAKFDALRVKISGAIAGCNTLKQAQELLPEFKKYLPNERLPAATANTPMIANVVSDLIAAGWPKKKELTNV